MLLSLLTVGCPAASPGGTCDRRVLEKLSAELNAASEREQVMMVVPGLEAACGEALPSSVRSFYRPIDVGERSTTLSREPDKQLMALRKKACSNAREVLTEAAEAPYHRRAQIIYDGCDLARYSVFERSEIHGDAPSLITWGMHQWLLDQGLKPVIAEPITRALMGSERRKFSLVTPLAEQVLPAADGIPLPEGAPLYVSMREIVFDEKKFVSLDHGSLREGDVEAHVVESLYSAMAEEAEKAQTMAELREARWSARVLVIADRRVPFSTIVDVMYTAGRAAYREYVFVVEGDSYSFSAVPVAVPMFDGENVGGGVMTVDVSSEGFTMQRAGSETRVKATAGDYEAVAEFARELVAADPEAQRLVISAEGSVELQEVVGAIAAARGGECSADGSGCVLPTVIIDVGGSHARPY